MSNPGPYEFTPPEPTELERLLPGYIFEGLIAKGGMGAVYKARQRSLDRDVAVKILPRELGADPQFRKSFETEARAMARLNHANLIGVYDSGDVDGMPYIVMEYVPGKSLYHSAYEKKIAPDEVVRLTLGILAGLGHAHEHGIIHRDIKPANILLTPKAEPKIGDFGLAVPTDAAHTGLVMGTPGYTAPEVIKNPTSADARSDIFAVGVIFYELLTGQAPGDNQKPPSALCECPASFNKIFMRATHPNPAFRYPDCASMARDLEIAAKSTAKPTAAKPGAVSLRTGAAAAKPAPVLKPAAAAPPKAPAQPADRQTPPPPPKAPEKQPAPDGGQSSGKTPPPPPQSVPPVKGTVAPAPGSDASLPEIQMPAASNWGLIRNILIVAALVVLGAVAWKAIERANKSGKKEARQEKKSEWAAKYAEQAKKNTPPPTPTQTPAGDAAESGENGETASAKPKQSEAEKPKPETPMEALERLRGSLLAGKRDPMPPGTVRRGEYDFFLVTKPMVFDQAVFFAEQHGGHLAIPKTNEDITWLAERVGSGSVWVGAGRNATGKWLLLDGSLWQAEVQPRGRGAYASLSDLGLVRGKPGNTPLPFFIQWHRDGSNPVSFDFLLQKTRETFDLPDPLFPPGSVRFKARRYLTVDRPVRWLEARNIAERAGGHLATVSDLEEAFWLEEFVSQNKPAKGFWIGGTIKNAKWTWSDGENWDTERWAENQPDKSLKSAALMAGPDGKWIAADPKNTADGFIIEWSDDGATSVEQAAEVGKIPPGLAPLRKKAVQLVSTAVAERDKELAANARSFLWDLDVWFRGLDNKAKAEWKPNIEKLKLKVADNRVPGSVNSEEGIKLSKQMAQIASHAAEKQKKTDETCAKKLARIQDVYLKRLANLLAEAQRAGRYDVAREIKKAIAEAKVDVKELPNVFGVKK